MVAVLLQDFDTMTITKVVGKEILKEVVPRYKKGKRCDVIDFDFAWMMPEERGGTGVAIGTMDYLRLTYPNGTKTKYYDLFEFKNE